MAIGEKVFEAYFYIDTFYDHNNIVEINGKQHVPIGQTKNYAIIESEICGKKTITIEGEIESIDDEYYKVRWYKRYIKHHVFVDRDEDILDTPKVKEEFASFEGISIFVDYHEKEEKAYDDNTKYFSTLDEAKAFLETKLVP